MTRFRICRLFYWTIQIIAVISLDALPKLWSFVANEQRKLSQTWISDDFDRSILFLICLSLALTIIDLPPVLYQKLVLTETAVQDFWTGAGWNRGTALLHDIANGRAVRPVLVFTMIGAVLCKLFGLGFNGLYVLSFGVLQLAFAILYPILTQPKTKTLSVMESGSTRDVIQQMASEAKFPLKNTCHR